MVDKIITSPATSASESHERKGIDMRKQSVNYGLVASIMVCLCDANHWLSDGCREMHGFARRFELCGVGIRIILNYGGKVIWRMTRTDAEFLNSVSLFATKENA